MKKVVRGSLVLGAVMGGLAVAFGHVGRVGDQSQLAVSQVKQALQMLAPLEGA